MSQFWTVLLLHHCNNSVALPSPPWLHDTTAVTTQIWFILTGHWNHDIFSLQKSGPYHKAHCRVSLIISTGVCTKQSREICMLSWDHCFCSLWMPSLLSTRNNYFTLPPLSCICTCQQANSLSSHPSVRHGSQKALLKTVKAKLPCSSSVE